MRVPRVFHAQARVGAKVLLAEDSYHHLIDVLRRAVGDPVSVIDGVGGVFCAQISHLDKAARRAYLDVGEEQTGLESPVLPLAAAVAIPRGHGMDLAIRFASETGLSAIQPLTTARTVTRPPIGAQKLDRWRRIARESAQQCGRRVPMEVTEAMSWEGFLETQPTRSPKSAPRCWIALPGGPLPSQAGLLDALEKSHGPLAVAIGPEGGFTPDEVAAAVKTGLEPMGFPTPVLKTPTAVVYLGALGSLTQAR